VSELSVSEPGWEWLSIESAYERVGAKATVSLRLASRDAAKKLARVKAVLDVKPLTNEELAPPQSFYERTFEPTGLALPGIMHTLKITVTDESGQTVEVKRQYQS
jgi:hypothetical protein